MFRSSSQLAAALLALTTAGAGTSLAQTADQLKTRFATFLGAGKYVRMVWQVESQSNRKPNFDLGGTTKIMAMDSKDGVVRQLAGNKSGTHYSSATFTWDGRRVIWTDNVKFQYVVTDFLDTTKKKVLLYGYEGDGRCYRTADGKDWVLATEAKDYGKLFRINIDDTTEKVLLATATTGRVGYAGATCWATMSPDGKYVAGGFPNYGRVGWLTVANKTFSFLDQDDNGCWPSIARDNTYDICVTPAADADYHRAVRIVNMQGVDVARPNLLNAGLLGSKPNSFYEALRWTADRDYVTLFAFYNTDQAALNTDGYANPRLVNIKTLKMAAVVDNPTTPQGNADAFFYTDSDPPTDLGSLASRNVRPVRNDRLVLTCDLRGRAAPTSRARGCLLRVAESGAVRVMYSSDRPLVK